MSTTRRKMFPGEFGEPDSETIVLEVRQIIGTVEPDENGTEPMLKVAYDIAARHIGIVLRDDGNPSAVEWQYRGTRYALTLTTDEIAERN